MLGRKENMGIGFVVECRREGPNVEQRRGYGGGYRGKEGCWAERPGDVGRE